MLSPETEGYWNIVISSLQDICSANESLSFDSLYSKYAKDSMKGLSEEELNKLNEEITEHKSNVGTAKRLVSVSQENLQTLITNLQTSTKQANETSPQKPASQQPAASKASGKAHNKKTNPKKVGRLYYTSKFNPLEPIYVGSEVAFKLKNRHFEEWIQCEVMKVIGDGIKFEIRDPEPDENNNPGQTFKAGYKEILLIPTLEDVPDLVNYPYGSKVIARYPETTTFYPAIVVGHKKDGSVRLKFDGEEEVNKETEIERRLVLPFPEK
ncbi:uncharacterized protein AC631_03961 [Debaryomyces fabryi]|uniref:SGF29 C-terminal domain-containing protein n=1 Tax=Debaryomyces fabryi TaxID=58627 RepID=A0A0V1PVN7_9ASCO|nr:uncharacterized protein AC631_03961 [Debaryomyces fabryi]KSA00299.1 hypothetical protein AC631_03961 [Debaryomyces fabryi]CUM49666.1 unnamed protein product [Debaryomyces fabryi]